MRRLACGDAIRAQRLSHLGVVFVAGEFGGGGCAFLAPSPGEPADEGDGAEEKDEEDESADCTARDGAFGCAV